MFTEDADLEKIHFQPVFTYVDHFKHFEVAYKEIRQVMKNIRLYVGHEDIWMNNEKDKRVLINALKDEKILKALGIDVSKDEIIQTLNNPQLLAQSSNRSS